MYNPHNASREKYSLKLFNVNISNYKRWFHKAEKDKFADCFSTTVISPLQAPKMEMAKMRESHFRRQKGA
jgi:hypothetical protein